MSPEKPRVMPRKPASVDPAAAAAFERRLAEKETEPSRQVDQSTSMPVHQPTQQPMSYATTPPVEQATSSPVSPAANRPADQSTRRRGVVQRATKGALDRITAYLPVELGERVRIYCATHRVDMSAIIAEALQDWLEKRAPRT